MNATALWHLPVLMEIVGSHFSVVIENRKLVLEENENGMLLRKLPSNIILQHANFNS